jgi:aldehyde:ferredoxin oxidoreductase
VELFNPALGKNYTEEDLKLIGERIWNLAKMFNVREGFTRKDDYLPERIFTEPLKGGISDGKFVVREEFEIALTNYYKLRGWDPKTSIPLPETLERLGLREDLKL